MKCTPDLTGKRGVSAQVERMASQVSNSAWPEQWILFIFPQLLRVSAHTRNNLFRWIFGKITNAGDVHLLFRCRYSTWEPEEHILDQRLVQAYEEKWVLFIFIVDEKPLPVDPRGSLSHGGADEPPSFTVLITQRLETRWIWPTTQPVPGFQAL